MSRDTFTRCLAIFAIAVAALLFVRPFVSSGGGNAPRTGMMGRMIRWIVYCAVEEEFRNRQPERQDPGVLLQENTRPARRVGPDGALELDHGRSW